MFLPRIYYGNLTAPELKVRAFYFATPLRGITWNPLRREDSKGNISDLPVTPHTAVRISTKDNKRVQLYFNTLLIKDSTITGSKSHFFNAPVTPIIFGDITKIEIQK
jgi:hypothetical protein